MVKWKFSLQRGLLSAVLLLLPGTASAFQPNAPFEALKEKNRAAWAEQDKQIDQKLAALKEKFGKRPNIIYILADDVGWGELGWQGGGKPFFIYGASFAQQVSGSEPYKNAPYVEHANAQSSFMAMHNAHVARLLETLKKEGIAENTLVVW